MRRARFVVVFLIAVIVAGDAAAIRATLRAPGGPGQCIRIEAFHSGAQASFVPETPGHRIVAIHEILRRASKALPPPSGPAVVANRQPQDVAAFLAFSSDPLARASVRGRAPPL